MKKKLVRTLIAMLFVLRGPGESAENRDCGPQHRARKFQHSVLKLETERSLILQIDLKMDMKIDYDKVLDRQAEFADDVLL